MIQKWEQNSPYRYQKLGFTLYLYPAAPFRINKSVLVQSHCLLDIASAPEYSYIYVCVLLARQSPHFSELRSEASREETLSSYDIANSVTCVTGEPYDKQKR